MFHIGALLERTVSKSELLQGEASVKKRYRTTNGIACIKAKVPCVSSPPNESPSKNAKIKDYLDRSHLEKSY